MFNKEKNQTTRFIWHQISIIIMFICITVASIIFGKASILFWYIAPVLLQLTAAPKETEENKSA